MADNEKRILEMLANKDISVDEAHRLLRALEREAAARNNPEGTETATGKGPRYLRVSVQPAPGHEHDADVEHVHVRLPVALIRAGMRLASLLPPEAEEKIGEALHEKGIDLNMRGLKPKDVDELIAALTDLQVDVAGDRELVKVFVE
jgi:hypothetical protein